MNSLFNKLILTLLKHRQIMVARQRKATLLISSMIMKRIRKIFKKTSINFERKFKIFLQRYHQKDFLEWYRHPAFSIAFTVLSGSKRQNLTSESLNQLSIVDSWTQSENAQSRHGEPASLANIFSSNRGKSLSLCFELRIERWPDVGKTLSPEFRNEIVLGIKLLSVGKNVRACKLAYHKPAETVQSVELRYFAGSSTEMWSLVR